MGGLLHRHPRLHHLSFSRRENWAMGGWGGSFYGGGATLFCFKIWGVPSSASLWGAYDLRHYTTKQFTGATLFAGLAHGLSCRRQYCGIAAHLWVVQMEVDMFFFFLVFWSFGFRVGFHAPLLVARMGVLVCPCTFYVCIS